MPRSELVADYSSNRRERRLDDEDPGTQYVGSEEDRRAKVGGGRRAQDARSCRFRPQAGRECRRNTSSVNLEYQGARDVVVSLLCFYAGVRKLLHVRQTKGRLPASNENGEVPGCLGENATSVVRCSDRGGDMRIRCVGRSGTQRKQTTSKRGRVGSWMTQSLGGFVMERTGCKGMQRREIPKVLFVVSWDFFPPSSSSWTSFVAGPVSNSAEVLRRAPGDLAVLSSCARQSCD